MVCRSIPLISLLLIDELTNKSAIYSYTSPCLVMSFPRMLESLNGKIKRARPYQEFSPVVLRSPEDPQPHGRFTNSTQNFVHSVHVWRGPFSRRGSKSSADQLYELATKRVSHELIFS